jgi:hypothetical protein
VDDLLFRVRGVTKMSQTKSAEVVLRELSGSGELVPKDGGLLVCVVPAKPNTAAPAALPPPHEVRGAFAHENERDISHSDECDMSQSLDHIISYHKRDSNESHDHDGRAGGYARVHEKSEPPTGARYTPAGSRFDENEEEGGGGSAAGAEHGGSRASVPLDRSGFSKPRSVDRVDCVDRADPVDRFETRNSPARNSPTRNAELETRNSTGGSRGVDIWAVPSGGVVDAALRIFDPREDRAKVKGILQAKWSQCNRAFGPNRGGQIFRELVSAVQTDVLCRGLLQHPEREFFKRVKEAIDGNGARCSEQEQTGGCRG